MSEQTMSKSFPIGVVLTGTTGRLLCDLSDFHQMVEYLTGGPVWTHELAYRFDELRDALLEQHPELCAVTGDNYVAMVAEAGARWGETLSVEPVLALARTRSPLDTLRGMGVPDEKVIVVESATGETP